MKKVNDNNKLAIQMLIAMVSGIVVGLLFMAIRESVGADSKLWITINSILFQNISAAGTTGSNPLLVILNIIPSNIGASFSVNNSVLAVVFLAVVVGLGINALKLGKDCTIYRFCEEASKIVVVFLNFVVKKFGPVAIFMLLCNTFATYGIDYLKPALVYVVLTVVLLLVYLFIGYPVYFALVTKKNPLLFIKKIFKVIVFGFSTSSSAATLPLNQNTTTKELGVDSQIASFVLPLGMTINMDGTAIMQVVATLFIAGCGDYDVSVFQLVIIMVLALIAYSLILAINRPIEMLVTSLNVTGGALTSIAVAKSEGRLNLDAFNKK